MKKVKNSKISNVSSKNNSNSKVTSKQTNKQVSNRQSDVGFTTTNEDNSFKVTDCR